MKKLVINILISIAINVGLFFGLYAMLISFTEHSAATCFCNAAFVMGAFNLGIAGLIFVSDQGVFDGITYAFKNIFSGFSNRQSYLDYMAKKNERRSGGKKDLSHFIVNGVIYLVLAIILTAVYF
jgi:hypothetical protein